MLIRLSETSGPFDFFYNAFIFFNTVVSVSPLVVQSVGSCKFEKKNYDARRKAVAEPIEQTDFLNVTM